MNRELENSYTKNEQLEREFQQKIENLNEEILNGIIIFLLFIYF